MFEKRLRRSWFKSSGPRQAQVFAASLVAVASCDENDYYRHEVIDGFDKPTRFSCQYISALFLDEGQMSIHIQVSTSGAQAVVGAICTKRSELLEALFTRERMWTFVKVV